MFGLWWNDRWKIRNRFKFCWNTKLSLHKLCSITKKSFGWDRSFKINLRNCWHYFCIVSANCGGLLGLFCGVSLLSLVEIIYYVTLRLWGNMKATKKTSSNEADIEAELSKHVNFNSIASSKLVHEDWFIFIVWYRF